jgi:hypothetical protein
MPKAALKVVKADFILSPDEIREFLRQNGVSP